MKYPRYFICSDLSFNCDIVYVRVDSSGARDSIGKTRDGRTFLNRYVGEEGLVNAAKNCKDWREIFEEEVVLLS